MSPPSGRSSTSPRTLPFSAHRPRHATVLNALIARNIAWLPVSTSVYAAVRWATLLDTPGTDLPALDDPFEPLIMLYERGGGFVPENGFIELSLASVRIGSRQDHLSADPIVPLDRAVLGSLDEAARCER